MKNNAEKIQYYHASDLLRTTTIKFPDLLVKRSLTCALTVVKTILAALPSTCTAARYECLGLIARVAASESAPSSPHVAEECILEIRSSFWYFVHGLQFDDVDLVGSYVDVLGCLGMKFEDLRYVVIKYLNLALTRDFPIYDLEMIKNTIADLSE